MLESTSTPHLVKISYIIIFIKYGVNLIKKDIDIDILVYKYDKIWWFLLKNINFLYFSNIKYASTYQKSSLFPCYLEFPEIQHYKVSYES